MVAESGGCGCLPLALCVGSIALDVVAAVAVSGGCGCLPLAFRTRHLQCASEELLLQELVPSYCVATGGRWFCSLLMGNQRRVAGAKILGKQRKYVKQKVLHTNRSSGFSKLTKENEKEK